QEDRAALRQAGVPLDDEIEGGIEQRMAGADEGGQRLARLADQLLLEGDPLVALEHGLPAADLPITIADQGRDVLDLVALGLALVDRAAQPLEGFEEGGGAEVRPGAGWRGG